MLDTVVINLLPEQYRVLMPERFSPHANVLHNRTYFGAKMAKSYYNANNAEKAKGYLPRLTLLRPPYSAVKLKIEFSAPKLMFGNNFEELQDADFDKVIEKLLKALKRMGIETSADILKNARLSVIHYSKNILLERETPCHTLIQTLEKADMNSKLDLNKTDFRNSGQMVKYHASTFEIALYDKVKDLEQASKYGDKRGSENDYDCQVDLFGKITKPEVLRFEIRLPSRKIKSLLKSLGCKPSVTFNELFNGNISRMILLHYWQDITNGLYLINIDCKSTENLSTNIEKAFPRKRPQSKLALMGFVIACQENGVRGAKLLFGLNNSQFYRLKAEAKKLDTNENNPRFRALALIKSQLKDFIPLIKDDIVNPNLLKTG